MILVDDTENMRNPFTMGVFNDDDVYVKEVVLKDSSIGNIYMNNRNVYMKVNNKLIGIVLTETTEMNLNFKTGMKVVPVKKILSTFTIPEYRGINVMYDLYDTIIKEGFLLVSNNFQSIATKNLWKRFTKVYDRNIFIIEDDLFMVNEAYIPIIYNGNNIPDEKLWSVIPDMSLKNIVFALQFGRNS